MTSYQEIIKFYSTMSAEMLTNYCLVTAAVFLLNEFYVRNVICTLQYRSNFVIALHISHEKSCILISNLVSLIFKMKLAVIDFPY